MPTVNEALQDDAIRHAIYLSRYRAGIAKRMLDVLAKADADLVRLLRQRNVGTPFAEERLQKLLKAVRIQQARLWQAYREALRGELFELASYEADHQARMIQAATPSEVIGAVGFTAPTARELQAIVTSQPFNGRFLRDWAAGLERDRLRRVEDAIRIGLVEGETIDGIVRRVAGTKAARYADGVLAISRRNAEGVVRTAVTHVTNRARNLVYTQNKGLVKGWRYVATLDTRTTEICMGLDGKVFKVGEGPTPPQHFNCRSTSSPIIASFRELGLNADEFPPGTRASMNGQVPATESYGTWLKRQPVSTQVEALGPTKAALFRKGGLTVDKFTDPRGRAYTLDELRRREAEAFRAAGL